ncbi:MAG: glycosyltransferase family 2 protein [Methylococcales symbiont of Hymedesmia sp. n. MRB-2018]|nr:MAG: glycosyltransferase family 2 protein [Methylococcales symbiont of Hymedesmia sp. n. MRB-2018]KAF3982830.1 MAG: glycosyltransferase family 2 protein [Methylococcales symbiont of Hymedesmia sp. n. MRB-2018]
MNFSVFVDKVYRRIKPRRFFYERLALWCYLARYPFYSHKFPQDLRYKSTPQQIFGGGKNERSPGVSGFYRLYNEADFLHASVLSHLPFFDELILLCDSESTDETPKIAADLAQKYDKIKYFYYQPNIKHYPLAPKP